MLSLKKGIFRMWGFYTIGFFSATLTNAKYHELPAHQQKDHIMVRARVKADLERLVSLHDEMGLKPANPKIWELPGHDYPCRIVIPHTSWTALAAQLAASIDYSNFKDAVEKKAPTTEEGWARHDLYMKVWQVMYDAETWLERKVKAFKNPKSKQQTFDYWNDPREYHDMSLLEQVFAKNTSTKKGKKSKKAKK